MKNDENEPKEYFERNILLVVLFIGTGLFLDWLSVYLLMRVNPWGTLSAVPGLVLTLQGLWLLVNPYAIIYDDRVEIKQNFIYNKEFYYLDAKRLESKQKKGLKMVYNDEETESLPLFGMRASYKDKFKIALSEKIAKSVVTRDF
ncbi:MAG: hypothetical protein V4506_05045 [Bacteroidota bacterium]